MLLGIQRPKQELMLYLLRCKPEFLFATFPVEMVLRHSDNLSATIQKKTTSAAEGQQLAQLVIAALQCTCNQEAHYLFWIKVLIFAESVDIDEPQLPR